VQQRPQRRRGGHGRALPRELTGGNRSEQRFLPGEVCSTWSSTATLLRASAGATDLADAPQARHDLASRRTTGKLLLPGRPSPARAADR